MPSSLNLNEGSGYFGVKVNALNLGDASGFYETKLGALNLMAGTGYEQILSRMAEWEWEDNIWRGRETLLLE
jgi:hypothetical protein